MKLYFAPLACSLATRVALHEAGAPAEFVRVDLAAKRTEAGEDYLAVNPKGQVPALVTDEGAVLTEGPAVLQFIADRFPAANLAPPPGTPERTALQAWLNFITSELHSAVFVPLFHPAAPEGAKEFARFRLQAKFDHLSDHLEGRDFLLDRYSVADAYLLAVLNWAEPAGVDLGQWPVLEAYRARLRARPAVTRALAEEMPLYAAA